VEDSGADVDMNVVMDGNGAFIEVQGTAEGAPFDREALDALIEAGSEACGELLIHQQEAVARGLSGEGSEP